MTVTNPPTKTTNTYFVFIGLFARFLMGLGLIVTRKKIPEIGCHFRVSFDLVIL